MNALEALSFADRLQAVPKSTGELNVIAGEVHAEELEDRDCIFVSESLAVLVAERSDVSAAVLGLTPRRAVEWAVALSGQKVREREPRENRESPGEEKDSPRKEGTPGTPRGQRKCQDQTA